MARIAEAMYGGHLFPKSFRWAI